MVAPIEVKINGDIKGFENALVEGSKHIKVFGQDVGVKLPPKLNLAVQGVKGVAKVTKTVASAAKDAAAEEQIFQDAMSQVTGKSGDYNAALDETIKASQRKAFTDTETRKALLALTTATGSAEEAQGLLTAAQDIARVAGVDLETASDAVAKAFAGQDTALMRMLPGLEKGATSTDTIKNATKLAEGAADDYAKSSQAMGEKVKIAFGEITEEVGGALAPALRELGAVLKPLIENFIEIAKVVLPPVLKVMGKMIEYTSRLLGFINKLVDAVQRLIGKLKDLLEPLNNAVGKIKDILPGGNMTTGSAAGVTSMARVAARGVEQAATKTGTGGVTINIYGDPAVIEARVTKALRDYARRNGAGAVFTPERT